jgi:hypothetical protein
LAILDQFGRPVTRPRRSRWAELLARYDAAQTTTENTKHWGEADHLSPDSANSLAVRQTLRARTRYEVANNCYAESIVETFAADVVGSGPRPQIHAVPGDYEINDSIERKFLRWAKAARLRRKLHELVRALVTDGEGMGLLTTRQPLTNPVKLFLRTFECDRCTTPWLQSGRDAIDGIRFDGDGEPLEYDILPDHPGGSYWPSVTLTPDVFSSDRVIHLFRTKRAEQHRGLPLLTPALPLFSQLRRYTLAVLAAAETAADHAMVIQTNQPPDETGFGPQGDTTSGVTPEAMDVFELAQRMVTVLPEGFQLGQVDPKQPTTTYGEFKREILNEAMSVLLMPYNVGAHDASGENFASGKLNRITYARLITKSVRPDLDDFVLDPLLAAWYAEARLVPGYIPDGTPPLELWDVSWQYDPLEDIDEQKAAGAQATKLQSGQTTLPLVYARQSLDARTEMRREADLLGVPFDEYLSRRADQLLGTSTSLGAGGQARRNAPPQAQPNKQKPTPRPTDAEAAMAR